MLEPRNVKRVWDRSFHILLAAIPYYQWRTDTNVQFIIGKEWVVLSHLAIVQGHGHGKIG